MSIEPEAAPSNLIERTGAELSRLLSKPLPAGLHIVATPIGNLGDITLRALVTLQQADIIYCEDTRHSRTLMVHFGLSTKLRPYHEHNADHERPRILERLAAGERVALISDAGTPLISDPGFKLARDVIAAGHGVLAAPGACAAIAALSVAGLPTDCFLFAGFLPPRGGQRQSRLKELREVPATLVMYEAPTRVADTLDDMLAVLGDRRSAIARELTKLHEEVWHGSLADLRARLGDGALKGEIVLLVAPPVADPISDAAITAALVLELETASARDAVRAVAERLGAARSRVYDLAMALRKDQR